MPNRSPMNTIVLIVGLTLMVFIVPPFAAAQTDLFVGTWKVNIAKSTYQPQAAAPKTETLRFDAAGDRITVALDGVNSRGPYHQRGRANSTAWMCRSW